MMVAEGLFARICDKYCDIQESQFGWQIIHESQLMGKVKIKLWHKSRPTLVFSETVETATFLDYYVANMGQAFTSLLHQCCAALDIQLVEKGAQ